MTAQVSRTPAECQSRKSIARRRLRRTRKRCYSSRDIRQDGTQAALSTQQAPNWISAKHVRARSNAVSPHGAAGPGEKRIGHPTPDPRALTHVGGVPRGNTGDICHRADAYGDPQQPNVGEVTSDPPEVTAPSPVR